MVVSCAWWLLGHSGGTLMGLRSGPADSRTDLTCRTLWKRVLRRQRSCCSRQMTRYSPFRCVPGCGWMVCELMDLTCMARHDVGSTQGSHEAFSEAVTAFKALGAASNLSYHQADFHHGCAVATGTGCRHVESSPMLPTALQVRGSKPQGAVRLLPNCASQPRRSQRNRDHCLSHALARYAPPLRLHGSRAAHVTANRCLGADRVVCSWSSNGAQPDGGLRPSQRSCTQQATVGSWRRDGVSCTCARHSGRCDRVRVWLFCGSQPWVLSDGADPGRCSLAPGINHPARRLARILCSLGRSAGDRGAHLR